MSPDVMDSEVVKLCDALNSLPGVETVESCCGHDRDPFQIWFKVSRLRDLPRALYYFDGCHCGFYDWHVEAQTDCGMSPVVFMVVGPVGAFAEADEIARIIVERGKADAA